MSTHVNTMIVNAPIETVWKFIESIDHWSSLIPGYIQHRILNERESEWIFLSNFGIIKKKIHLNLRIQNWIDLEKITLDFNGISDRFSGTCSLETKRLSKYRTYISNHLEINMEGPIGKMLMPMIKNNKHEWTEEFKTNLEEMLKEFAQRPPL